MKKQHAETCNSATLTLYQVYLNYILQRNTSKSCGLGPIISTVSIVALEYHESLTTCSGLVL